MKPVEFEGVNIVYGAAQEQYRSLPAHKDAAGIVTTCYELTEEEISVIKVTGKMYIQIHTFNQPLQPILPFVVPAP